MYYNSKITYFCSFVQMAMMSQTFCQPTLLCGGGASSWSTSYGHLYRYDGDDAGSLAALLIY